MKKPVLINLKVSSTDLKRLKTFAHKYANGNLSAWLRFAGLNFKPKKVRHI